MYCIIILPLPCIVVYCIIILTVGYVTEGTWVGAKFLTFEFCSRVCQEKDSERLLCVGGLCMSDLSLCGVGPCVGPVILYLEE